MDVRAERVDEPDVAEVLRVKARRVRLKSLALGTALTALVVALP